MDVERQWWETRRFALLAIALTAVPLLWPAIPPFLDVPGHMGRYRVMLGTDAELLSQWYRFEWRLIGYLGVDLLVAGLGPLLGLEAAAKLVVIAIPMLTAAGMLWISREAHGRVQPLALVALPLAYHLALQFGFLNYTLAMALALNGFALWLRLGRLNRIRLRALLFVPLSCLVWVAHLFGWLTLGLLAVAAETMRQREQGRNWPLALLHAGIGCLPLALPFLMFLSWNPGRASAASDYLTSLWYKPTWLAMALRDRWQLFDIASIVVIGLILYRCIRAPRFGHAPAVTAAALALLALYLAVPFGSSYFDMRIAPYVVMLALLSVRAGDAVPRRERAALALIGLALFAVRTTATTVSLWIESSEWNRHLEALDHVPRGARMVTFVGSTCDQPWRMQRLGHLPGMAIVRRAAFSNDQYFLGETALLKVVAPGIEGFSNEISQIVMAHPCPEAPEYRTLSQALAQMPRDRFDYVWLIDPPPFDATGMHMVWRNRTDLLLRIDEPPLSPPVTSH